MAKSKYEFLLGQIMKLIFAQGEFTFLSCSNTFLNRNNYSLNMVTILINVLLAYKLIFNKIFSKD